MEATIKYFMRQDISSLDKIKISKEEVLKHKPTNKREKEALEKISAISDDEIKKQTFEFLHGNDYKIHLTNAGHSKGIFKIDRLANSYECFVAKDKKQLENLTKNFDYKNYRKSRGVAVSQFDNYVMFNVE